MASLLESVLEASGGRDRWSKVGTVSAVLRIGGPMWSMVRAPDVLGEHDVTVDLGRQRTVFRDYHQAGLRGVYTPERVSLLDENGDTERELLDPRGSFQGAVTDVAWDTLQALYFVGYATWNYLTAPRLLTLPGVQVKELPPERPVLDPQPGLSDGWRRLAVTFPDDITVHNSEQTFYYDEDGLQRRMDYAPVVTGGIPGIHMIDGHQEVAGIVLPTRRRVFIPNPEGPGLLPDPFITMDYSDIRIG
ncbi:hypothetical protein [Streptomyces liangshanensis]|uniref:Uncharacterized protein n=1 Tax=Streptomyces liangshanensis TaxID=2717324 RepID=A0A6G9H1H6_9ACTN|nr:hypothetical protein [Streptomyces liangshanensis]QIQ04139.1 hypothetical protein HA039_19135 [Streptomyces liangshanensis]